jgi:hypothetical protein
LGKTEFRQEEHEKHEGKTENFDGINGIYGIIFGKRQGSFLDRINKINRIGEG